MTQTLAESIRYTIHYCMITMWVYDKLPELMGIKFTRKHRPVIWDLLRLSGTLCNLDDKIVCSFGRKYRRETVNLAADDKKFILQLEFAGGSLVGIGMLPFTET